MMPEKIVAFAFFSALAPTWCELNPERMMPWMMGHWMAGYYVCIIRFGALFSK